MRLIIIATGSWGDVRPNLILGQALQAIGYDVVLVAAEEFRAWVEQRNVTFAGLSLDLRALLDAQVNSTPLQTLHWMREAAQSSYRMGREIAALVRPGDAVLASEGITPLVNGIVEKQQARLVHVNLQPWVPTAEFPAMLPALPRQLPIPQAAYNRWGGEFVRRAQWWAMGGSGNRLRTIDFGLPRQTWLRHRALLDTTPSLLLVSQHVIPRPSDWHTQHRITGYLFDDESGWEPPQALLQFLAAGPAPISIGFGSMRERDAVATTRLLLEAVRQAGVRAVLLSGWSRLGAASLPDEVLALSYAPHSWLFPRVAAVVHHGGAGTTAAALRAGVPSVVVPVMADQPFWGRRLCQLGASTRPLSRAHLTADKLATAVREAIMNRAIQAKAAELGARIRAEEGLGAAVGAVREILESGFGTRIGVLQHMPAN
ncbi:MAG: glycosyltransferase family 1 protein [Blastochloris sp.]|nr:glycosyltransferase family 1 protein [Blastochloris sp.]